MSGSDKAVQLNKESLADEKTDEKNDTTPTDAYVSVVTPHFNPLRTEDESIVQIGEEADRRLREVEAMFAEVRLAQPRFTCSFSVLLGRKFETKV